MMQAMGKEVHRLGNGVADVQQSVETILEKLQSWTNQPPITNTISDCGCKGQIKGVLERMDQLEAEKIQMQAALTDITKKIVVLNRVRDSDIEPRITKSKAASKQSFDGESNNTSVESQCQENKSKYSYKASGLSGQSKSTSEPMNQSSDSEGAHRLDIDKYSRKHLNKTNAKTDLKHKTHKRKDSLSTDKSERPHNAPETDLNDKQESSKEVVLFKPKNEPDRRPVRSKQMAITLASDIGTESNEETNNELALVIHTPNALKLAEDDGEEEEEVPVAVVHQPNKHNYSTLAIWSVLSQEESRDAEQSGWKELGGVHSVICVDISESMSEGEAWKQTRTFMNDYINGLERCKLEHDIKEEHVALVTYGSQTKVMQRLTNEYGKIKDAFDNLKLGGPSPMYGGTMMAFAAVESSRFRGAELRGMKINAKIIFITDGHPTEGTLCQGPDEVDPTLDDETKSKILLLMDNLQRYPVDIYCVPVGDNANKEFLQSIVDVGDGRMLEYTDGTKLSRRLYLSLNSDPLGFGLFGRFYGGLPALPGIRGDSHTNYSPEDREHLMEIWDDDHKNRQKEIQSRRVLDSNNYAERAEGDNHKLLPVGTRVRRGPDWCYRDVDAKGPGTVIGHQLIGDQLNVEWDFTKHRGPYNYGNDGQFDVIAVDEPRLVAQGQTIAVGCLVKPGQRRNLGVSRDIQGVVIRVLNQGKKIEVRWNTGKRGTFSYGENGIYDVVLCQDVDHRIAIEDVTSHQTSHQTSQQTSRQASQASPGLSRPNKNKNKNI